VTKAAVHTRVDFSVTPTSDRLRLEECKQIRADLFLMGRAQAVWRARIDFQRGGLDELGREQGRSADRRFLHFLAPCIVSSPLLSYVKTTPGQLYKEQIIWTGQNKTVQITV